MDCLVRGLFTVQREEKSRWRCLTIDNIQSFMTCWPNLVNLDIESCDGDISRADKVGELISPGLVIKPRSIYINSLVRGKPNAETISESNEVKLFDCRLVGHQLATLAQSPNPLLANLDLRRIGNVTNSDMLDMLLTVAHTLNRLHIQDCEIHRATGKEISIDAAISNMISLEQIIVSGHCATELCIQTAKPKREDVAPMYSASTRSLRKSHICSKCPSLE